MPREYLRYPEGTGGILDFRSRGETPAIEVLAIWLTSEAYGMDAQYLDPALATTLRCKHRLGYAPCVVGIGPISRSYVVTIHDELKQSVSGYLGLLTFSQAQSLSDIASKLYIRTLLQLEL